MKKLILTLIALLMLRGCSEENAAAPETSNNETSERSEVTVHVETGTAIVNTDTVIETTTAETTTYTEAVTETVTEPSEFYDEFEDELHTMHIENVPLEERAALEKLNAKYGKDFRFICRDVQWEFFGGIPEKKPTTYTLEDDEGRRFCATGTEESDEISGDNYAFLLHKDELLDHAKDHIRSYTQAGKLWMLSAYKDWLPFETPAEMTYEEFFSCFCEQKGQVTANILLPEGTELPEELSSFDWLNSIYIDGFGCRINLGVYYLPQSDYDSLEDVIYGNIDIDRDHLKGANE